MKDLIERLRLGDGTSPDHLLLLEAADALEKAAASLEKIAEYPTPRPSDDLAYEWCRSTAHETLGHQGHAEA